MGTFSSKDYLYQKSPEKNLPHRALKLPAVCRHQVKAVSCRKSSLGWGKLNQTQHTTQISSCTNTDQYPRNTQTSILEEHSHLTKIHRHLSPDSKAVATHSLPGTQPCCHLLSQCAGQEFSYGSAKIPETG